LHVADLIAPSFLQAFLLKLLPISKNLEQGVDILSQPLIS